MNAVHSAAIPFRLFCTLEIAAPPRGAGGEGADRARSGLPPRPDAAAQAAEAVLRVRGNGREPRRALWPLGLRGLGHGGHQVAGVVLPRAAAVGGRGAVARQQLHDVVVVLGLRDLRHGPPVVGGDPHVRPRVQEHLGDVDVALGDAEGGGRALLLLPPGWVRACPPPCDAFRSQNNNSGPPAAGLSTQAHKLDGNQRRLEGNRRR